MAVGTLTVGKKVFKKVLFSLMAWPQKIKLFCAASLTINKICKIFEALAQTIFRLEGISVLTPLFNFYIYIQFLSRLGLGGYKCTAIGLCLLLCLWVCIIKLFI